MAWPQLAAPSPDTSPAVSRRRLSTLQRNLTLDLSSAVGLGTTTAIVSVLLPSVARREGLDAMGLAALAALPFLATLLTMFAGRIGPRSPARLAILRAAGAVGLLLVLIAPHPLLIAATTFTFWVSFALGAPLQQRIWATIYPSPDRGRLLGLVGTGRFTAGTLALLAITVAASSTGWVPIVAVVAGIGALSSLAVGRMEVPGIESGHSFSAKGSLRAVVGTPMVRRIAGAQLLFGAGVMAAPAFIAMVHVDRLGLDVSDIALAGLVSYGSTAATIAIWGRLAGRFGSARGHLDRHTPRGRRPRSLRPGPGLRSHPRRDLPAGHLQCRGQCLLAAAHRRSRSRGRAGAGRGRTQLDHGPAWAESRPS